MKTKPQQKVPITKRAIIARINRKLHQQPNPEVLRAARGERQAEELGDYYTIETGTFGVARTAISQGVCRVHLNLEKLGRELGVLEPWERIEERG